MVSTINTERVYFLERATREETSVYHLEAAIAYLHTTASGFESTNWKAIHHLYSILHRHHPTPIIALNKAIATAYAFDKDMALEELQQVKGLSNYYLYHTAIGEIYFEKGEKGKASIHYQKALSLTSSSAEQQLLLEKIAACTRTIGPGKASHQ